MAVKRTGLGKGLDSLIPDNKKAVKEKKQEQSAKGPTMMKINDVEPNREQPRKNFEEDALLELADSIKQFGVLQPLIVQKKKDYYEIIAGERRWRGDGSQIRALFKTLRERIPGLVIRTSLISGLPGEGEAEFEELCEFLKEAKIERAGVFPFSPEDGTPAAKMEHVDSEEARRRANLIMELQAGIMDEFCRGFIGKTIQVLCEYYDEEARCFVGRSYADSPDIDGQVFFEGSCHEGDMVQVLINDTEDGILYGEEV